MGPFVNCRYAQKEDYLESYVDLLAENSRRDEDEDFPQRMLKENKEK